MKLKRIRHRKKLTQAALAERSRVAQQTISLIESGRTRAVSWRVGEALARALEVDAATIDEIRGGGRA